MDLFSVSKMVALEKEANEKGMSYEEMMHNAGDALAEYIQTTYADLHEKKIIGLIGSGNNGGDTLIALCELLKEGWTATAYLVKKRKKNDALVQKVIDEGGHVITQNEDQSHAQLIEQITASNLILDGILGTGFKLPLKDDISQILQVISAIDDVPEIIAVDCPSGVDCDTGESAEGVLMASATICMAGVKKGLLKFPAYNFTGEIKCVDISLPDDLKGLRKNQDYVADIDLVRKLLPKRNLDAHKGTFGTCMVIGGSTNYCGAILLASKAAYRVGVGLVKTAIPGSIYDAVAGQLPESTWIILPHSMGVINSDGSSIIHEHMDRVSSMLVGPGLGNEKEVLGFLEGLLKFKKVYTQKNSIGFTSKASRTEEKQIVDEPTLVFDAEALRLLIKIKDWEKKISKTAVLTPHPGEMAALTGMPVEKVQADRENTAKIFAKKYGHVIVLKGAITVIANPEGKCTFIPIATPALATAGSGDVLAGMITGFIAQGLEPYNAAVVGAWIHAKAGMNAATRFGQTYSVIARDIIEQIPAVIKYITGTK